jgi:hypothetical protein
MLPIAHAVTLALRAPAPVPTPVPPTEAPGPQSCSDDTFQIEGHAVRVSICAPVALPAPAAPPKGRGERESRDVRPQLALQESFSSGGASFSRSLPVEIVEGSDRSRALDDVPLDKLGISKTLHLTIGFRLGSVQLEHALLVPGAIPLR